MKLLPPGFDIALNQAREERGIVSWSRGDPFEESDDALLSADAGVDGATYNKNERLGFLYHTGFPKDL